MYRDIPIIRNRLWEAWQKRHFRPRIGVVKIGEHFACPALGRFVGSFTSPPLARLSKPSPKNRKDARLYLQPELAKLLKSHIATKAPGAKVFGMPHVSNTARMLHEDVEAARQAWLKAAQGAEQRARREESDFLSTTNHEGDTLDFHALRHTCGAWLATRGVHPKVVQTVMRHSTITLTMDT